MNDPLRPHSPKPGHRRLWLGLAALLVTATALLIWAFQPRPLTVDVATVATGRFEQTLMEDGQLRLVHRYVVSAPTQAELLRPTLRVGDEVRAGDTVARLLPAAPAMIDTRTRAVLEQRVGSAQAHHDAARARMAQLQTALSQAELDAQQAEQLGKDRFIAAAAQTQARLRAQGAQQALAAGQADLRSAEHSLAEARAALARAQPNTAARQPTAGLWALQSPIDGQVVKLHHSSATTVQAGQPLLEIGDTRALEAVVDVLSSDVQRIPLGAPVRLALGGDGPPLPGTVARIEPVSFTKVSALGIEEQRVNVVVQLAPAPTSDPTSPEAAAPAPRLGDGFRVEARITLLAQDQALLLPTGALVRSGDDWQVLRLVDGTARAQTVQVRARNAEQVWAEGVAEGDTVILYPGGLIRDGQPVRARLPGR